MRFSIATAAVLLSGLTSVFAETFTVAVGKDGSLLYEPPSVTAKAGDVIQFQFMSKNHTITQSTFDKPCEAKADGVNSGFQFIPTETTVFPQWSITITNDTAPLWFYCAQGPHCQRGMVFAINPSAEKTFEKFKETALASPAPAAGGAAPAGGAPASSSAAAPGAEGTPAANAAGTAANSEGGAPVDSGAMSKAAAAWPVLLGSVIMGALVL